jgi:asparagine N-glycosylation enzyme membrane subunit Stt3
MINVAAEPVKYLRVKPQSLSSPPLTRLRERLAWARYLYLIYPGTGSNIDAGVALESWGEVVRYLPRAAEIGLLAPFPNMWLASGAQVGRWGRALSGLEMLTMYLVMVLALWGLWKRRDQLAIWFLVTIATLSVFVLGLVVANIGALYRMRYPFWMLLIIVGVDGALRLQTTKSLRQ